MWWSVLRRSRSRQVSVDARCSERRQADEQCLGVDGNFLRFKKGLVGAFAELTVQDNWTIVWGVLIDAMMSMFHNVDVSIGRFSWCESRIGRHSASRQPLGEIISTARSRVEMFVSCTSAQWGRTTMSLAWKFGNRGYGGF